MLEGDVMNAMTLDPQTVDRFKQLTSDTVLFDERGRMLGRFEPAGSLRYQFNDISDDELDQRAKEPAEFLLDDIIRAFPLS
jgi:hypothetical protein